MMKDNVLLIIIVVILLIVTDIHRSSSQNLVSQIAKFGKLQRSVVQDSIEEFRNFNEIETSHPIKSRDSESQKFAVLKGSLNKDESTHEKSKSRPEVRHAKYSSRITPNSFGLPYMKDNGFWPLEPEGIPENNVEYDWGTGGTMQRLQCIPVASYPQIMSRPQSSDYVSLLRLFTEIFLQDQFRRPSGPDSIQRNYSFNKHVLGAMPVSHGDITNSDLEDISRE